MSKVQTLLKVIEYQRQHPTATDADISSAVGISGRYLRKCRKEIQELSFHFLKSLLERSEVDLILSKLNSDFGHERAVLEKLQKAYLREKTGLIRIASSEDKPSNDYLQIGLWTPQKDRRHIEFWLKRLLYEPLLQVEGDNIDYRLASVCENVDGYSKWRIKLKKGFNWSDGKPIKQGDIISTLTESRISAKIREFKRISEDEIIITLNEDDVLFPYVLSHIPIFPSHSPLYDVTSGAFLMRKNKSSLYLRLYKNMDYYRINYPKIDWISLRTYNRSAFAVKAVMEERLDLLPLRSLHQIYEWSLVSPQSFPCREPSYYLLLINKGRPNMSDEDKVTQLKTSIDYNVINLHLSATLPQESVPSRPRRKIPELKIGYLADMSSALLSELALTVASSLGIKDSSVVDVRDFSSSDIRQEIDVVLAQLYFGYGYSRLRQYFHSQGGKNILGFGYPEINSLIERLDKTPSMEKRNTIGQEIVRKLQENNVIIILAPCFEYVLSNLYIAPSSRLGSLTDLIRNLSEISVKRGKIAIGSEEDLDFT